MADDSRAQVAVELLKAMDSTVKAVLSDEFRSIRDAIKSAEANFTQRLVQSESANARAIDALRNDLTARVADLGKRLDASDKEQTRAVKDAESRSAAAAAQQDERTKKSITEVTASLAELRRTLAGDIAASKAGAEHDSEALREELQAAMAQLASHAGEIQRVSSVLGGFARIFTGEASQPAAPAPVAPVVQKSTRPAAAAPAAPTSPSSSRKPVTVQVRREGEDASSLPNSGDIVEGIDTMFKLKK